jgi:UDP-GlcNAc3NAcA epimerase
MTGRMLEALEAQLLARRPDVVLVYGDTNSTLAAALAAAKLQQPVAHVEAGLRSFNRRMPEEVNRVVTDHLSELLFCPSPASAAQLAREGITRGVHVTGDVMIDAAMYYRARAVPPDRSGPFALATLHRAENTDDPARLAGIIAALAAAPISVLLPLHPRTEKALAVSGVRIGGAVEICEPLSYFRMLGCLQACAFVATDSGGLQKEAWAFGKKCVTLRDETEWTELVQAGANRVAGTDPARIAAAIDWALQPAAAWQPIYGDGRAGEAIVAHLVARAAARP